MNSPSPSFSTSPSLSVASTGVLDHIELPLTGRREGKIRISYDLPDSLGAPERRLFITTDRPLSIGCWPVFPVRVRS
jgi:hypothetical protein